MESGEPNQSPPEEKKAENPEHINIKVYATHFRFRFEIVSDRVGRQQCMSYFLITTKYVTI